MQELVQGIHSFQKNIFGPQRAFFERLAENQTPQTLFITCSDSRICPNMLTQTQPGELFILRNAGNIVPPYGMQHGSEAATIEYAVAILKVRDIIICGHSRCGAMDGLLHPELVANAPSVQSWLSYAEATSRIVKENYGHIHDPAARLTLTVEENVLVQLEHLRTHPSVAAALARGTLKLHGWVYKIESGHVFAFDPQHDQFLPVEEIEYEMSDDDHRRTTLPAI